LKTSDMYKPLYQTVINGLAKRVSNRHANDLSS
jgi:hypothetical protein